MKVCNNCRAAYLGIGPYCHRCVELIEAETQPKQGNVKHKCRRCKNDIPIEQGTYCQDCILKYRDLRDIQPAQTRGNVPQAGNHKCQIVGKCEQCGGMKTVDMAGLCADCQQPDNVNHPSHYTTGNIECLDAIRESMTGLEWKGYLKGNCIKYLWRYQAKGGVEDLKKCRFYLDRLIDAQGGKQDAQSSLRKVPTSI